LKNLNIPFSATDHGQLRVALGGRSAAAIIQSIRTPLTYLHIHSPTLEEAYLEMVGREEQK